MSIFSKFKLKFLLQFKNIFKRTGCSAVIAAGGSSRRMDGENKLFLLIRSKPVLAYTLEAFQKCGLIDEIIVVAQEDKLDRVREICAEYGITKAVKILLGGKTRLESVMAGVYAASDKAGVIAIHDGARPCITEKVIRRAVTAAKIHNSAVPAIPVTSTIKRVRDNVVVETVNRDELVEVQTPQVFAADLIKAALTNASKKSIEITDDSMAVELLGVKVHTVEGARENIKLTTRKDILIAEAILAGAEE